MTYNKIKDEIRNAHAAYLPGLLIAVVRASLAKNVFKPGGAARIVKEVEDEATEQSQGVASGSSPATGSMAFDLKQKPSSKKYCPECGWVMETDYATRPDGSTIAEWVCIDCGHYEPKPSNEKL